MASAATSYNRHVIVTCNGKELLAQILDENLGIAKLVIENKVFGRMLYAIEDDGSIFIRTLSNSTHVCKSSTADKLAKKVHGIGTALIDTAYQHSKDIQLEAAFSSHDFYRKLGFIPLEGNFTPLHGAKVENINAILETIEFPKHAVSYEDVDWEEFRENSQFQLTFAQAIEILVNDFKPEFELDEQFFFENWYWDISTQPMKSWSATTKKLFKDLGSTDTLGLQHLKLSQFGRLKAGWRLEEMADRVEELVSL
ncbi:MAG: GNAT family N-acetyltransferase [Rhabdochlamydiaceae bacterium]|nr:GNAT family N-acetyltransferase [Candidatus Amphrikana amoebophyrae]